MILVDSSVWIDHFREHDEVLSDLLERERVLAHPFVIGELALGSLHRREAVLTRLRELPQALVATDAEVSQFIERERLFGLGIGYTGAHLLATVRLTHGTALWTRDKRLAAAARRLDLAFGRRPH